MSKEVIILGVANDGEKIFKISDVMSWDFKKKTMFSNAIMFQHEGTFYSMKRKDFNEHFKGIK